MKALLALVLLVPCAHAIPSGHVEYTFQDTGLLEVSVEAVTAGREAAGLRARLDADRDGDVQQSEVDAAEAQTITQVHGVTGGIGVPGGRILVDGREQISTGVVKFEILNATGPVGDGDVQESWVLRLAFERPRSTNWTFQMDTGNTSRRGHLPVTVTSAVLTLPPGHEVAASGGLPLGARVDTQRVEFARGLPERSGWVTLEVAVAARPAAAPEAAPGLQWAVVAGALLAVARRRA